MESGLIFNQLICEFESRRPCQIIFDCQLPISDLDSRGWLGYIGNRKSTLDNAFVWVVAQLAEHRTVTAAREGSTPFDPPNTSCRGHEIFIDHGVLSKR